MKGEHAALSDSKSPLSLDATTALCEHIQKQGFQSHLFSDIILTFLGKGYPLHRIILAQSSYFHSLLSGPWKEHGKPSIHLRIDDPNVTAEGLELALAYMYGVAPVFTGGNVIAVLAAACFLCLENLSQKCVEYILQDMKVESFLGYQHLSEKHCYGRFANSIRNACWSFLCTHASRELLHVLPKLSLQVLCRLLKSDELWVLSEAERYKLAKQALIDWKLARMESANGLAGGLSSRKTRGKFLSARKCPKNLQSTGNLRNKNQRGGRPNSKDKCSKKKDTVVPVVEQSRQQQFEISSEMDLKKLKSLWEQHTTEQSEECKEDFKACVELFTGGGIIFAHMEADEVLQAKKELEDANLPSDVANDSIWHNVLLKAHVLKFRDTHSLIDSSFDSSSGNDSDEEMDEDDDIDDDDDDDEDEADYEDDADSSEGETSGSEGWSTDRSSHEEESDTIETRARDGVKATCYKKFKVRNISLVCFNCIESGNPNDIDSKTRKTTGGFTWIAKPDVGMCLIDFPPFRFGAEFVLKDKRWNPCLDSKSREVFYGGSMWKIVASEVNHKKEWWHFGIYCRSLEEYGEAHMYQDQRKKVHFAAKMYITTLTGLRCVGGSGVRSTCHESPSSRDAVGINLGWKDVVEDEPLRVSAVVQLMDD